MSFWIDGLRRKARDWIEQMIDLFDLIRVIPHQKLSHRHSTFHMNERPWWTVTSDFWAVNPQKSYFTENGPFFYRGLPASMTAELGFIEASKPW